MSTEKHTKNLIQENKNCNSNNSDNNKEVARRNLFSLFLGGVGGLAAATLLKSKEANATPASDGLLAKMNVTLAAMAANIATVAESVRKQLENFNTFMKPFSDTVDNVKKVGDSWNNLLGQINKVMDATEKSRDFLNMITSKDKNIFYLQAKQLADYVTNLVSGNSDWAKIRLRKFDWYSQALVRAMNEISMHYKDVYSSWERASLTSKQLGSKEKLFVAGANQHLKGAFHEVKAFVFNEVFNDIQKQVKKDKKNGKIPENISESEAVHALSQQLLIQIQISQYAAITEILNSINILVLSKNEGAFNIPKDMKLPNPEDFQRIFEAATSGDRYPGNFKEQFKYKTNQNSN